MSAPVFVDTNVLVYAHDRDAGAKQQRAAACLKELWQTGCGRLSTQVLQEFYVNATQKIPAPVNPVLAREILRNYAAWVHSLITPTTVLRAAEIGEAWRLSFWDSMILAAAEQDGSATLLTEDLSHGQVIAGIRVVNPFA